MSAFKDNADKEWTLVLDAPTIRAVRNECGGLDLVDLSGEACEKLAADPCLLVEVLWVLCRDKSGGIDAAAFGRRLVGDAIERATTALLEAIADFFPKRRRELARALASKNREIRDLGLERALAKLNDPALAKRLTAALEAKMDGQIEAVLTQLNSATNSPATSESAPAGSPSAN